MNELVTIVQILSCTAVAVLIANKVLRNGDRSKK